jgi:hypothetical protein
MLTALARLFEFLFTHIIGAVLLAGLGLMLICCGGLGLFHKPQEEPASVSVAELEKGEQPPRESWVKIDDGFIAWGEIKSLKTWTGRKDNPEKRDEQISAYYVPVVSKGVVEAGTAGTKARVFLKMTPSELRQNFREIDTELKKKALAPEHMAVATPVSGLASSLLKEQDAVFEGLMKSVPEGQRADILVVSYGERPQTHAQSLNLALCLMGFGALFFLPLVVQIIWLRQPPPPPDPWAPQGGTGR